MQDGQGGSETRDPELQRLVRRLIRPMADAAEVQGAIEGITGWAADDPRRKAEVARYGKLVRELGYGTEAARDALKRLAG